MPSWNTAEALRQRYENIVGAQKEKSILRDPPLPLDHDPLENVSEIELQCAFFAGHFGKQFTATCGRGVEIVQFGEWNREPGPDFVHSSINLEGQRGPEGGDLEMDLSAEGWEQHGHATNPAFDRVRLHLFFQKASAREFFTRTSQNRLVPQVHLDLNASPEFSKFPAEMPAAIPGRCVAPLADAGEQTRREIIMGAARHRLERKAARLRRTAVVHGQSQAIYQGIAETLGYKSNKLPFLLLAQRFPLKTLHRLDQLSAEAILFGASGFLESHADLASVPVDARHHLKTVWEAWWPRRAEHERFIHELPPWKLSSTRPANHPQRRLAALSILARDWPAFARILEASDIRAAQAFFKGLRHDFWTWHYTLKSRRSPRPLAVVGESRVSEIFSNVIYPWLVANDPSRWDHYAALRATGSNQKVDVAIPRLFGGATGHEHFTRTLAGQQGLIQIYEDFCLRDLSDCARCPFPDQVQRW